MVAGTDGMPRRVDGPLRRPSQGFGVVCEFATEAEAHAFTALVSSHFAEHQQASRGVVITWHDETGAYASADQAPPQVPIVVMKVTTSTDGWAVVHYQPLQGDDPWLMSSRSS